MHLLETRDSVFRLLLSVKADITAEEKKNAPISAVSESSTGASALNETRIH